MIDPSIALQVRPPQINDPLETLGRAMSLKSMVNQQALQQLQRQTEQQNLTLGAEQIKGVQQANKLKQREIEGQQLLSDLLQKNTKWDDEEGLSTDHKAVNQGLIGAGRSDIAANYAKQQKEIETASWDAIAKHMEVEQKRHERLASWASILQNADPAQKAALYPSVVAGIKNEQLLPAEQIAHLPGAYAPEMDAQIGAFADQAKTAATQFDENMKKVADLRAAAAAKAEKAAKEAATAKDEAETAKIKSETAAMPQTLEAAQKRIDAIFSPDDKNKDMAATNARYRDMLAAIDQYSPAAAQKIIEQASKERESVSVAKNTLPIKIEQNLAGQQAQAANFSQDSIDLEAEKVLNGATYSNRNKIIEGRVLSRAAAMAKERGMTSTSLLMEQNAAKANKKALEEMTDLNAKVEAFSDTAKKNMTVLQKAVNAIGGDSPLLNKPIRDWDAKLLGDPKVSAFKAALIPAQTDIAKILNSSNATGVLSDSARHEMEQALGADASPAMIKAALDVFAQDMQNRKEIYAAAQKDLKEKSVVPGGNGGGGKPLIVPGGALDKLIQAEANKKKK